MPDQLESPGGSSEDVCPVSPCPAATSSLTGGSSPAVSAVVAIPGGDAGMQQTTTDPRGVVSLSDFNMLGQTVTTIAGFTTGVPSNSADQTTTFTHDGDGNQTTMTAVMPAGTPSQTTAWIRGVTTSGGSTVNSNDLVSKIEYPDKTTGAASTSASNDVSYTWDALGETLSKTDQNGSTHTYSHNLLGRTTADTVTTLGSGVDGSVRRLGYSYTVLGLPYLSTSYSDTSGTTIVNQDEDLYNGLGQLTNEYQAHSGAVVTTGPTPTPQVQYAYAGPGSSQNYSRLTTVMYPNARLLHYGYTTGLDDAISRVSFLADDNGSGGVGSHLADYSYLGLSTLVQSAYGNGAKLTYIQKLKR